jgi:hypothetical protein
MRNRSQTLAVPRYDSMGPLLMWSALSMGLQIAVIWLVF